MQLCSSSIVNEVPIYVLVEKSEGDDSLSFLSVSGNNKGLLYVTAGALRIRSCGYFCIFCDHQLIQFRTDRDQEPLLF